MVPTMDSNQKNPAANFLLDLVLLPIFVFQFILFDRAPFTLTNADKVLNGFSLFLVAAYAAIVLVGNAGWKKYGRPIVLGLVLMLTVGVTMIGNITTVPGITRYLYHDGAALSDVAFEQLLSGHNPYQVDYRTTSFAERYSKLVINDAGETMPNPALEQYVYLPATFMVTGVANSIEKLFAGTSNARVLVLLAYLGVAVILFTLLRGSELQYPLVILYAFNPVYYLSLFEGRNDMLLLLLLLASFYALYRRQMLCSGVLFGLALATKQYAWLVVPFIAVYLYAIRTSGAVAMPGIKKYLWSTAAVAAAFIVPFFLWSPSEFIRDTLLYPAGLAGADSYPISGYGLSQVLIVLGKQITDPFPFGLLILVVGVAVVVLFGKRLRRNPSVSGVLLASSILVFCVALVSRAMNDNYISFVTELLIFWFALNAVERAARSSPNRTA